MKQLKSNHACWLVPGLLLAIPGCGQNNQATSPADGNPVAPASAEVTDPNEPVRAYVRAVHTVRGAGPLTLALDGEAIVTSLTFGNASEFIGVHGEKVKIHAEGPHRFTVVNAEGQTLAGPLNLDLERGEDITVAIGGSPGNLTLTPFEHTNRGPDFDRAKVAVLHADKALPEVDITVGDARWNGDIGYGEITGYQSIEPGTKTLKVRYDKAMVGVVDIDRRPGISPPAPVTVRGTNLVTLTQQLNLQAGEVYSVLLYADANGAPRLRVLEDKFVPPLIRSGDVGTPTNAGDADTSTNAVAVGTPTSAGVVGTPTTP